MNTREMVLELERRARACGLSMAEVCRRAEIFQSTWTRWKSGANPPNFSTWSKVVSVIEDAERSEAA